MNVILLSDFKKIEVKNKLYVFLNAESCRLCDSFISNISNKIDKDDWTFVLCRDEDEEWLYINLAITHVPQTYLYKDNDILYQIGGMLFETQLKNIKQTIKKFFNDK
jgi:hypothetical protein